MDADPKHLLPAIEPDLRGTHGCAWINPRRPAPDKPNLGQWVLYVPGAHPVWHSYALSLCHLRDLPGYRPALRNLPGATHELSLSALDPRRASELWTCIYGLTPQNFVAQMIETDESALARMMQTVRDVIDGRLNPDTDNRAQWIARFGDNCIRSLMVPLMPTRGH